MLKAEKLKLIRDRRGKLAEAGEALKAHFVGLDEVIDRIMGQIDAWYVMPEVITRPVIINLWGMTGVGKTDLVRRLVMLLGFGDRFVEVQMEGRGQSWDDKSIKRKLLYSSLEEGEPGVLLIDEIQRFRTIDEEMKEVPNDKYQDLWTLLSDGRFNVEGDGKGMLFELLAETLYEEESERIDQLNEDLDDDDDDDGDEGPKAIKPRRKKKKTKKQRAVSRYKMQYWSAMHFRRVLRLKEPIQTIMTWDERKRLQLIYDRLEDDDCCAGLDYSKLLIFVSGNIDEAYTMSGDADDADTDADVFHERSKTVDMVQIKSALRKRFKPEQISRLGNTHIIYAALSRTSYERIIAKRIVEVIQTVKARWKLTLNVDKSVEEAIYRNGVFPAQGVRPVLTTVGAIFESTLPNFVLAAFESNKRVIDISFRGSELVGRMGRQEIVVPVDCALDKSRNSQSIEKRLMVAIHEAAHSVVYASLFDTAPTQIRVGTLDHEGGFVSTHRAANSLEQTLDRIATLLAGGVGEEIIFGRNNRTTGCVGDRERATELATLLVRRAGLGPYASAFYPDSMAQKAVEYNTDIDSTNGPIEAMLRRQEDRVRGLLMGKLHWLKVVADELATTRSMTSQRFAELAAPYVAKPLAVLEAKEELCPPYSKVYSEFWKKHGV